MPPMSRRKPVKWTLAQLLGRRWSRTLLLSVLVGMLSGFAARALETLVDVGFTRLIGRLAKPAAVTILQFSWGVLLLPVVGGLVSGVVIAFLCRPTRAHGTAVLIDAFHHGNAEMSLRDSALKALAAAVVISCGGSVGKEAAIAVLCAALGAAVSRRLGVSVRERRSSRPWKPRSMPVTLAAPWPTRASVTARMTALRPGQSPPPVRMPTRMSTSFVSGFAPASAPAPAPVRRV